MIGTSDYETNKSNLEAYGYKLVTWEEFLAAEDRPEGLLERAMDVTAPRKHDRQWVVYDPEGDSDDWLLVGERDKIAKTTVEDLIEMEPPEGPLSPRELDRTVGSVYR